MAVGTAPSEPATARDLVMTRVFDAPLQRVWSAWTDPEQLVRWFFPANCAPKDPYFDITLGGSYRYTFVSNDGTLHRMVGVFREIAPFERLVFTHGWANPEGIVLQDTLVTVHFVDLGAKTRVTFRHVGLETEEGRASHGEGWGEALGHLAALLAESG